MGQARKYVLYAVGEILLVMIGILLALQVNNWNADKKANKLEDKLLIELRSAIHADTLMIETAIVDNENAKSSCQIIISHFVQNLPIHDSLQLHFENANLWWKLLLRKSAFENAKSYGLHFIRDDSTRLLLTNFYEFQVLWSNTMNERQTLYYYNTVVPLLTDLFETTSTPYSFRDGIVPYDFEVLRKSKKYRNILKTNIKNRGYENDWLRHILRGMKELDQRLKMEIDSN